MTSSVPPLPPLFGSRPRALHCLGVGGMGLGPLAIYAAGLGFSVSGSDDALTDAMRVWLERAGVVLTAADAIPDTAELVVAWGDAGHDLPWSPMPVLVTALVERALDDGLRALDLGTSTLTDATGRRVPNDGLVQFKCAVGATAELRPVLVRRAA